MRLLPVPGGVQIALQRKYRLNKNMRKISGCRWETVWNLMWVGVELVHGDQHSLTGMGKHDAKFLHHIVARGLGGLSCYLYDQFWSRVKKFF